MQRSTNGPDWTDIATMMGALEQLHECRVELIVTAGSQAHNGMLNICLKALFDRLPESDLVKEVKRNGVWPNSTGQAVSALVFRLMYDLDYAISEVYVQRYLPAV